MFDIIITNCNLLTMNRKNEIINPCDIGIKDGKVVSIDRKINSRAEKIIDGKDKFALPGFINCHTHVYQALIEGIGYDMHFNPWNIRYLIPIISNMNPDHARVSAELAALEMIKSGTTTFSDHWYLHTDFENIEAVTEAFDFSGLRSHIVFGFLNESFAGRKSSGKTADVLREDEELLNRAKDFVSRREGWHRTTTGLGPGSTEDVGIDLFKKIIKLGKDLDVTLVTHISGWVEIVSRSLEKHSLRDLEYAHSLGFTGPKSIALHGVWLSEDEIRLAAETRTKIVHNPVANMHLGYGIAPVTEMISAGIKVGLGTDGAASYTYDMLEIAKTAAMLQKVRKMNAEALTAEKALQMLTIDGAEVLGMGKITGSVEIGKQADIILVDANNPHNLKGGRPVPQLVYSARSNDVLTSIVNGKIIMEDRKVLTMDEETVLKRANDYRAELFEMGGTATESLLKADWPKVGASWRKIDG
jgi:5-methylthioadenosine/S-adenosylhomocysteine deaminase